MFIHAWIVGTRGGILPGDKFPLLLINLNLNRVAMYDRDR